MEAAVNVPLPWLAGVDGLQSGDTNLTEKKKKINVVLLENSEGVSEKLGTHRIVEGRGLVGEMILYFLRQHDCSVAAREDQR